MADAPVLGAGTLCVWVRPPSPALQKATWNRKILGGFYTLHLTL